jgi:K+-sensing histidine kinase KdpD
VSADARPQGSAARGRLRIYLGYAPGAGTTCALLSEGRRRAEHGTDVVVASAETHGRPHTEDLLLAFAHTHNATQLVLGATPRTWPAALRPAASIRSRVIRRGGGLDVHIITCTSTANGVPAAACEHHQRRRTVMRQQNTSWPGRVRQAAR